MGGWVGPGRFHESELKKVKTEERVRFEPTEERNIGKRVFFDITSPRFDNP